MRGLVAALALAVATTAVAAETPTASEAAAVEAARATGQRLYAYDQAAWHTTDTLQADMSAEQLARIRGWIVTPVREGLEVVYYGVERPARAVYRARYDGQRVVDRRPYQASDAAPLTPEELALVEAQRRAQVVADEQTASGKMLRCSPARSNLVVLPPLAPGEATLVYFLTPQVTKDEVPLGGHYRVDVPPFAAPLWRAFTNSCLTMKKPPRESRGIVFVSHVLDPQPNEVHVFQSLSTRTAIGVITMKPEGIWSVMGERVRLERRSLPRKTTPPTPS